MKWHWHFRARELPFVVRYSFVFEPLLFVVDFCGLPPNHFPSFAPPPLLPIFHPHFFYFCVPNFFFVRKLAMSIYGALKDARKFHDGIGKIDPRMNFWGNSVQYLSRSPPRASNPRMKSSKSRHNGTNGVGHMGPSNRSGLPYPPWAYVWARHQQPVWGQPTSILTPPSQNGKTDPRPAANGVSDRPMPNGVSGRSQKSIQKTATSSAFGIPGYAGGTQLDTLRQINAKYSRIEKLLYRLKVFAILHFLCGFTMLSCDMSRLILIWITSNVNQFTAQRFSYCVELFYPIYIFVLGTLCLISLKKQKRASAALYYMCIVILVIHLVVIPALPPASRESISFIFFVQFPNSLSK